jgi:hypothetical protein
MKNGRLKKILAIVLSCILIISLLPATAFAAAEPIDYIDSTGTVKQTEEYTVMNASMATLNSGWYLVSGNITLDQITISGEVHLILQNEKKLTVTNKIVVNSGNSFTVYAQSTDASTMGKLDSPIIGSEADTNAGNITINGGIISTHTNDTYASSIGGGRSGSGGTTIINGGIVSAQATYLAAGIGGGQYGSGGTIIINGGTVNITSGYSSDQGAGIGGGQKGSAGNITINGGTVNVSVQSQGYAIGTGMMGSGGSITINGGVVKVENTYTSGNAIGGASFSTGTDGNAVIYLEEQGNISGSSENWDAIVFKGDKGTLYGDVNMDYSLEIGSGQSLDINDGSSLNIAESGSITNNGEINIHGSVDNKGTITNNGSIKVESPGVFTGNAPSPVGISYSVSYVDENGDEVTLTDSINNVSSSDTEWSNGWYVVDGTVIISSCVKVSGDVKLILKDGA